MACNFGLTSKSVVKHSHGFKHDGQMQIFFHLNWPCIYVIENGNGSCRKVANHNKSRDVGTPLLGITMPYKAICELACDGIMKILTDLSQLRIV
jgi:hypothetical protein